MSRNPLAALLFCCLVPFVSITANAYSADVAVITQLKGALLNKTGKEVRSVNTSGTSIRNGDQLQTMEGTAIVTFRDGATLLLSPHTSVMIQQRKETVGWFFKKKVDTRRLTCFTGKFRFKSGNSAVKTFIQTPTALIELKGTDTEAGYDQVNTYLQMYDGNSSSSGAILRGIFENPGVDAATKSQIYSNLKAVHSKFQAATTPLDRAKAELQTVQLLQTVADTLKNNPDDTVKKQTQLLGTAADVLVSESETNVIVEQVNELEAGAEQALENAKKEGDSEKVADIKKTQEQIATLKSTLAASKQQIEGIAALASTALNNEDADALNRAKNEAATIIAEVQVVA